MPARKTQANTSAKVIKPVAAKSKATSKTGAATKKTATKASAPAKKTTAAAAKKAAPAATTTKKATAPKKTAAKSKVEEKVAPKPKTTASRKRKAEDDDEEKHEEVPVKKPAASKKRKVETEVQEPPAKKVKALVKGPVINHAPTEKLDVFVFGEGTAGELGLGTDKKAVDVKRPRLNPLLTPYGVVQIAAGGMHVVALTHDNKILTWGVNDSGALGRDTEWDGGLKDMDDVKSDASSDEDEDDDNGLNPKECVPGEVDWSQTSVAEGTQFVQVAAGDSSTFVLTDDGLVYGWGCFRSNEGPFGFTPEVNEARRPILISDLKKITALSCGANHALALDMNGAVFAWGSGQQNQLGRRIIERTKISGLKPQQFGLPKGPTKGVKAIESGAYHSFAITKTGDVYSWGLNNFGETGIMDGAGQDDAVIIKPQLVKSLKGRDIALVKGGGHHSLAVTAEGECLVFGRIDECQGGMSKEEIAAVPKEDMISDEKGPRIMAVPTKIPAIKELVVTASASGDNSTAITRDGKAYSWGFSANYQTGQGTTDDVEIATLINNTAVKDRKLNGAYCGGQYSILTAPKQE